MAAPHVTGVIALLLASKVLGRAPDDRSRSPQRLTDTARDLGAPGPDRYYAAGLVDAAAALRGTRRRRLGRAGPPRTRARRSPQVVRMISTLQGAWWLILLGTEPSRKRLAPVMPLLPTTMRSAPRSSATSRMASAGSPWRA